MELRFILALINVVLRLLRILPVDAGRLSGAAPHNVYNIMQLTTYR